MKEQTNANHVQIVPAFHFGIAIPILVLIVCSAISLYRHWYSRLGLMLPSIALLGSVMLFLVAFFARQFALKAQDRAIRAEENLRHFAITGNLLDSRLTPAQIVALRFAPNNEFVELAQRAADQKLYPKQIKESIKVWKGDYYRV